MSVPVLNLRRGRVAGLALGLMALGACQDHPLEGPTPAPPTPPVQAVVLTCRVDAAQRTGACRAGNVATAHSAAEAARLAMSEAAPAPAAATPGTFDVVFGGQGTLVSLALQDVVLSGDTLAVLTAQLRNLLDQPLGLQVGTGTADPGGVRVGIVEAIALGSGTVAVDAPDGTENMGTGGSIPLMRFRAPILPNASEHRDLRFRLAGGVTAFTFRALVSTGLRDESAARRTGRALRVIDVALGPNAFQQGCILTDTAVTTPSNDGMAWCWGGLQPIGTGVPTIVPPGPAGGIRLERVFNSPVSAGGLCGRRVGGGVFCWGVTPLVLAEGGTGFAPWQPAFPAIDVRELSIGTLFACALDATGGLWCQGDNGSGQLGIGFDGPVPILQPSRVRSIPPMRTVQAGSEFACAVSQGRSAFCWGSSTDGQLGNGTTTRRTVPTRVVGIPDSVMEVAVGRATACARTQPGDVWCWGNNDNGMVGNGAAGFGPVLLPVRIITGGTAQLVAGEEHACARSTVGEVRCWGANTFGQSGATGAAPVGTPQLISATGYTADSLVAAQIGTCFREGTTWQCFGSNSGGALGLASPLGPIETATPVPGLSGLGGLAFNSSGGCGLRAGNLECWGEGEGLHFPRNGFGDGSPLCGVAGGLVFRRLAWGFVRACGLRPTGAVYCWGLEPGRTLPVAAPESLATSVRFRALSLGQEHACAISQADSTAYCWGRSDFGQLGTGTSFQATPVQVSATLKFLQIGAGSTFTCAIDLTGAPWCWGANNFGQLGRGTIDATLTANPTPQRAGGPALQLTELAVGGDNACGVTAIGDGWCWGNNTQGKLGFPPEVAILSSPSLALGILRGSQFSLGGGLSCGLSPAGVGACSGFGSLGDGTTFQTGTLRRLAIPSALSRIATANDGGCAIDRSARLWCWGPSGLPGASATPTLVPVP
ncbi:MAG: hypothetical protein MUF53_00795 [Gemmatimonadaceae bacterium]|nr:hypothetical protein [Gemmatimonadaceae bacterium]